MSKILGLFAVFALCLAACTTPPQPLSPGFFYWKTSLELSAAERSLLDSLHCKKLYVKVLDIGRNPASGEIEPYARTEMRDSIVATVLEIVPCIFITNEVFQNLSEEKTAWLAKQILQNLPFPAQPRELLFDCDWTPSTRAAFFLFLKKIRADLPAKTRLSATIRLHQYKFPKQTGVPPADRGMLMFYNTGDVDTPNARNSIFHPDDAHKYLNGAPRHYALPLDLALPVFSWGLVYREGELWKIVPGPLSLDTLRHCGKYTEHTSHNPTASGLWEVREGTFLGGHYLRPGDELRVSEVSPELLGQAALLARKIDLAPDAALVFFDLDAATPEHYSAQLLDWICKTVRK